MMNLNSFSLNYENWNTFFQKVSSKDDHFAHQFKIASDWTQNETLEDLNKKIDKFEAFLRPMKEDECAHLRNEVARYKEILEKIRVRQSQEPEGDHFKIMAVVCEILGLASEENKNFFEDKKIERHQYFDLMRDSNFLQINCASLDDFNYDPGQEAAKYLNEHPEVKAVALGCGKGVNESSFNFCNPSEETLIWHSHAMTIDITPGSCDVITDLNDQRFWVGIKNESLQEVSDHTNTADLLFKNPDTIKNIARVLTPNGKLTSIYGITDENHKKILNSEGFQSENDLGKTWIKTSSFGNQFFKLFGSLFEKF